MATKRVKTNFTTKKDDIPNMDRISELPDHLIHHILSFVPTIDVVRMSILSRRWRRVWYSVPDLHFCDYDHIDRFHFHSQPKKAFYKFVDKCLKHRERSARYIADSFITKLRIEYHGDKLPALDNWSTLAIWRNVKELDIFTTPQDFFVVYYCLPEAVLNARSLTVLKLDCLTFDGSCSMSLPSLISLSLMYVKLNDEALHNLLLGCPALEKFVLTKGYGLLDPKISSLTLKFLEIIEDDHKPFKTLEFETINLQSLIYNGDRENIINLSACKAIRSLSLSDIMLRELENLICGFFLLESLTLYHCFDEKHIRICGQNLKSIRLLKYYDPAQEYPEITIEAPNLVSFYYNGDIKCGISMKELDNILNGHIVITVPSTVQREYEREWYTKLKRFLSKINFSGNTTVCLHVYSDEALIFPMNMRENCCSLWPNLKHLKVMTYCDLKKESELREALCWVSPSLETLVIEKQKEGYY